MTLTDKIIVIRGLIANRSMAYDKAMIPSGDTRRKAVKELQFFIPELNWSEVRFNKWITNWRDKIIAIMPRTRRYAKYHDTVIHILNSTK